MARQRATMAAMDVLPKLKYLVIALLLLVLFGVAGFHFIEHWSWFDGFYMVLTTITSIGYGEIHPLSHVGRIFNSFIIVTGVGLVLLLVGGASRALLEFELQSVFGRRRMEREISRLSDHFIICGAGRVGRSVARELAHHRWRFHTGESLARGRHRKGPRPGRRHHHGCYQYLHHPHRTEPEFQIED